MSTPLILGGQYGSPYSLKMRAVLRYRRIPFTWVLRDSKWDTIGDVPVRIIPVIVFPATNDDGKDDDDGEPGEAMVDSSPQIMRLESEFDGRSLIPTDPATAFLDLLIEDFADEWLTKAMYHYRWAYQPDIEKAGRLLPLSRDLQLGAEAAGRQYDFITNRQIERRALVGSTESNQPIIEGSYQRLLDSLQRLFGERDFVFGDRPGRADLGLFGQLSQLTKWDPTPAAVAVERAPKVVNWVDRTDDLSWLEVSDDGWLNLDDLGPAVAELLAEIGRTYAPFMIANHAALTGGADEVSCEIDGATYRQAPFKYQGKCLGWMRDAYRDLDDITRGRVDGALAGTGCEQLFT